MKQYKTVWLPFKYSISMQVLLLLLLHASVDSQWTLSSNGLNTQMNFTSIVSSGNKMFTGSTYGVWLSNDGVNWSQSSLTRSVASMTVSNSIIYASVYDSGVYRSKDNGVTWLRTGSPGTFFEMASANNVVYAAGRPAVKYTMDNGETWIVTPHIENYNVHIASLSSNGAYLYAGCAGGVYRSSNNGLNWSFILNTDALVVNSLIASDSRIFAGSYGVQSSTNNGLSWVNTQLDSSYNYSFCIYGNYVFSGTGSFGVYVSSNNGTSWSQINEGLPQYPSARALFISGNYIYAGISNRGIFKRHLNEVVGIQPVTNEIPGRFSLSQNYPNPFNPTTNFEFRIVNSGLVNLIVYDILGNEVASIVSQNLPAGEYKVQWDALNYSSGVYYYKFSSGEFQK